jgi:thiol-disulfide isomerase/thioredoxin
MKYSIILLIAILIFSCKSEVKEEKNELTKINKLTDLADPNFNILVADTVHEGEMMLLGKINRKGFELEEIAEEYNLAYEEHILDTTSVRLLEPLLKTVTLKVFVRSCCSDSQIHIPALFKILDFANFDYRHLEMIALSHDKTTPERLEKGFNIEYVPTIIVYKDGEEIGRFVEYAQETLEKDLLSIINQTGYIPGYSE